MKELSEEEQKRLAAFVLLLLSASRQRPKVIDLKPEVRFPLMHMAVSMAQGVPPEALPDIIMTALVIGILIGQKYNKPIATGDDNAGAEV